LRHGQRKLKFALLPKVRQRSVTHHIDIKTQIISVCYGYRLTHPTNFSETENIGSTFVQYATTIF
jgi:hypothetical protein